LSDGLGRGRARFPRAARMAQRRDFLAAQSQGRRLAGHAYMLFVRERGGALPARVGITVSRKVGNAVVRNRVKRWVRESVRQRPGSVPAGSDVVVVARPVAAKAGFAATDRELTGLLARARRS